MVYLRARRWRDAEMTCARMPRFAPEEPARRLVALSDDQPARRRLGRPEDVRRSRAAALQGFEGLKAREAKIPAPFKPGVTEAGGRVVKLYEAWGQPEKAREWRKKLGLKAPELPSNVFAR